MGLRISLKDFSSALINQLINNIRNIFTQITLDLKSEMQVLLVCSGEVTLVTGLDPMSRSHFTCVIIGYTLISVFWRLYLLGSRSTLISTEWWLIFYLFIYLLPSQLWMPQGFQFEYWCFLSDLLRAVLSFLYWKFSGLQKWALDGFSLFQTATPSITSLRGTIPVWNNEFSFFTLYSNSVSVSSNSASTHFGVLV